MANDEHVERLKSGVEAWDADVGRIGWQRVGGASSMSHPQDSSELLHQGLTFQ